ncbi:MAG: helix-turn-helix domain-containing protein [Treponemataceae bacterium]|nr:helix-turn-helix domain-containing protein [Treponemataceae bacterium]
MGFSENFRDELEYQGIQLKEFSRRSGISLNTLNKYNSGSSVVPNIETAKRIADTLHVSLDFLVSGRLCGIESQNPKIQEIARMLRKLSPTELDAIQAVVSAIAQKHGETHKPPA